MTRRRSALAALALSVGVAATVLPHAWHGGRATLPELVVGWALIGSGLAMQQQGPSRAGLLTTAAGIAWFMIDFAPMFDGAPRDALERTSLAYLALISTAVLCVPDGPFERRSAHVAVTTAGMVAVIGALGFYRVGLVCLGLAVVVAAIDRWMHAVERGSPSRIAALAAGVVLGIGVSVPAMMRVWHGSIDEALLSRAAGFAVVAASLLAAAAAGTRVRAADGIELGTLEAAVGRALGRGPIGLAFPLHGSGQWVDVTGRLIDADPHGSCVCDSDREVARVIGVDELPAPSMRTVLPLLRVASDHARLQSERRAIIDELDASRLRLLDAGARERAQLRCQLQVGPVARLDRVDAMLAEVGTLDELRVRLARSRAVIDAISRDLDPLAERGLRSALAELTGESGRQVRVRMVGPEPAGHVARAVWYTCAESVANASKHAGSSQVTVDVCSTHREVVATITDTGTGGADPLGRGLSGLADRAATVGGSLNVMSGTAGTQVRLTVPWAGNE